MNRMNSTLNKRSKTARKRVRRRRPRNLRARIVNSMAPVPSVVKYYQQLADPCGCSLVGHLPGEIGQIARYTVDYTATTGATGTAYIGAFWPALNGGAQGIQTSSSTLFNITESVGVASSPGYNALAWAAKIRPLAACIQVTVPALSALNIVGEIALDCMSADSIFTGSANVSIDGIFSASAHRGLLNRGVYEVKWAPGYNDGDYETKMVSAGISKSGSNVLVVAMRGIPNNTAITVKITTVIEATGFPGNGVVSSAENVRAGSRDTSLNAAAIAHHNKSVMNSLAQLGGKFVGGLEHGAEYLGRGLGNLGAQVIGRQAVNAASRAGLLGAVEGMALAVI